LWQSAVSAGDKGSHLSRYGPEPVIHSVEALHRSLRKIIKTRGAFPNEESALKLLFLAIRQAAKKWTMPVKN
jgi:transposase-like protein